MTHYGTNKHSPPLEHTKLECRTLVKVLWGQGQGSEAKASKVPSLWFYIPERLVVLRPDVGSGVLRCEALMRRLGLFLHPVGIYLLKIGRTESEPGEREFLLP